MLMAEQFAEHFFDIVERVIVAIPQQYVVLRLSLGLALSLPLAAWCDGDASASTCFVVVWFGVVGHHILFKGKGEWGKGERIGSYEFQGTLG